MPLNFDPNAAARRWVNNLGNAREKIKEGIENVTVSPMEKAAKASQAYLQGTRRAVEDGTYERGLRRVSLDEWKRKFIDKGLDRIGTGAADAEGEFAEFLRELKPQLDQIQAGLANMPTGKGENNFNRMVYNFRESSKIKRKR